MKKKRAKGKKKYQFTALSKNTGETLEEDMNVVVLETEAMERNMLKNKGRLTMLARIAISYTATIRLATKRETCRNTAPENSCLERETRKGMILSGCIRAKRVESNVDDSDDSEA